LWPSYFKGVALAVNIFTDGAASFIPVLQILFAEPFPARLKLQIESYFIHKTFTPYDYTFVCMSVCLHIVLDLGLVYPN
jgi:hypothetical protein